MTNTDHIAVYRYHVNGGTGSAEALAEKEAGSGSVAPRGEYFEVGDGIITIHADKFSVYAISYTDATTTTKYTVTFNSNGGSAVASQTVSEGGQVQEADDPTQDSYTFGGWYKDAACTDGNEWDFENGTVPGNITLYAKWTENESDPTPDGNPSGGRKTNGDKTETDDTKTETGSTSSGGGSRGNSSTGNSGSALGKNAGKKSTDNSGETVTTPSSGEIVSGGGEGNMSRQQMIIMLYRYAQARGLVISGSADLGSYSDSGIVASYAQEALAWGVANGIITGTTDGKLNPEGTATRAHFAAFVYRFASLNLAPAASGTEGDAG